MALKSSVKVGNITNLSEARYCAGMGVDFLGFPLDHATLSPTTFKEIAGWVVGPHFVLEGSERHRSADELDEIIRNFQHNYLEVDSSALSEIPAMKEQAFFMVRLAIHNWHALADPLRALGSQILAIVLKDKTLTNADWAIVSELSKDFLVIVPFACFQGDYSRLNERTGMALEGGDELKPGLKEYDHLADVLEALEVD